MERRRSVVTNDVRLFVLEQKIQIEKEYKFQDIADSFQEYCKKHNLYSLSSKFLQKELFELCPDCSKFRKGKYMYFSKLNLSFPPNSKATRVSDFLHMVINVLFGKTSESYIHR